MDKVPANAQFGIRFVEQVEFDTMLRERTFTPGFWYFIVDGNAFHIATSRDTYRTYGGMDIRALVEELLKEIDLDPDYLYQMITNQIVNNPNIIQSLANYFIADGSVIQQIANYILQNESVMQNITNQIQEIINSIVTSVVSIKAPDGSVLATNDNGVFTLPAATNSTFGIVKGQTNTTPITWHHVSASNGVLSINREQIEAVIDGKDTAIKNAINVRAEDNCIVGRNENGMIILPIRQEDSEPATPAAGTLYLVNESNADNP